MRIDELYGPGGFDPGHPSGNVLDALVHEGDEEGTDVRVRHYAADGSVLEDRKLTDDEHAFFRSQWFPDDDAPAPSDEDVLAVRRIADASVYERLGWGPPTSAEPDRGAAS